MPNGGESEDPPKTHHLPATTAEWTQAAGTILAAVIAAVALLIAALTFHDQQQTNHSQAQINHNQLQLNELQLTRTEQRYATRVAAWFVRLKYTYGGVSQAGRVRIQNRSPVPIIDVSMIDSQSELGVRLPDLPPCSVQTFDLTLDTHDSPFSGPQLNNFELHFVDGVASWAGSSGTLRHDDRPWLTDQVDRAADLFSLREIPTETQEAQACGESG
jgi:hypothetical protein